MKHTHEINFANPFVSFGRIYENEVKGTREELYKELRKISPYYQENIKRFTQKRILENNNTIPFGELLPWIIKDLTNWNSKRNKSVSVGWLAVYYYTLILDDVLDKNFSSQSYLISGTALAKIGLFNLIKIINGTEYEKYFENALNDAMKFELQDILNQGEISNLKTKIKYSEGKNRIALACAGAIAATHSKHSKFIIDFVKNLLLAVQYLDDLTDFEQDANHNNLTVLLNIYANGADLNSLTRNELIGRLITSGSMLQVVSKIADHLEIALKLIQQNKLYDTKKSGVALFIDLSLAITRFKSYLDEVTPIYPGSNIKKQIEITEKVERFITYVAQTT